MHSESLKYPKAGMSFYAKTDELGNLTFTLFDCSDAAQEWMGNDVASLVMIDKGDQARFLCAALDATSDDLKKMPPEQLLNAALHKFGRLSALEDWLKQRNFPYYEILDSWA